MPDNVKEIFLSPRSNSEILSCWDSFEYLNKTWLSHRGSENLLEVFGSGTDLPSDYAVDQRHLSTRSRIESLFDEPKNNLRLTYPGIDD